MITEPYNTGWNWSRVKYELELAGWRLSDIARAEGCERSAVPALKRVPIPRLQDAIGKILGVSPRDIWPARYLADGSPVRQRDWFALYGRPYQQSSRFRKDAT